MTKTRRQTNNPESTITPPTPTSKPKRKPLAKPLKLPKLQLKTRIQQKFLRRSTPPALKPSSISNPQIQSLSHHQRLNCPICLETFVQPTLTECGHAFCLSCAEQSLKHKGSCSLCRTSIALEDFRPSQTLSHLLQLKLSQEQDLQAINTYEQRVTAFNEQQDKRKLDPQIKEGDLIDYWSERRWREGKVISTSTDKQGDKVLTVQSFQSFSQIKQFDFNLRSRLLAKHRTFTKDNDGIFRCSPQIRIDIIDIRDSLEQSLLLHSIELQRWMERPMRQMEQQSDSLVRFTFSFERRDL